MKPLLDVQNLTVSFSQQRIFHEVVNDISLQLDPGEVLGIVGESGSGKTVTALAILRLLSTHNCRVSGEILFTKSDTVYPLHALAEKDMQRIRGKEIAMIFQEALTSLNPVFTCGSQVMEAVMLHQKLSAKAGKACTLHLFDRVKLDDPSRIFRSYPHQLSGGQKQRVMIAMAISCRPSLLIADEPTTALDASARDHIMTLLHELQQEENAAMIFISHDLEQVKQIAGHLLIMHRGSIVEQGAAEQVFHNPQHPYTKSLLSCRPPRNKKLRRLPVDAYPSDNENEIDSYTDPLSGNEISIAETDARKEHLAHQPVLLQVKNLRVRFPNEKNILGQGISFVDAVNDVSLEVRLGETLGLEGDSGCGKSTLAKAIVQLLPCQGEIIFDGHNLSTATDGLLRHLRRDLQIIFQDPMASLNPRMMTGTAITEPMKVHHLYSDEAARKAAAFDLLKKVQLPKDSFYRFPHELSSGQRQRICIARALALRPRFIICDECVSSLDTRVQAQILNLLLQLREELNFTSIFISHDHDVVKLMSDRILIMKKGKVDPA